MSSKLARPYDHNTISWPSVYDVMSGKEQYLTKHVKGLLPTSALMDGFEVPQPSSRLRGSMLGRMSSLRDRVVEMGAVPARFRFLSEVKHHVASMTAGMAGMRRSVGNSLQETYELVREEEKEFALEDKLRVSLGLYNFLGSLSSVIETSDSIIREQRGMVYRLDEDKFSMNLKIRGMEKTISGLESEVRALRRQRRDYRIGIGLLSLVSLALVVIAIGV